MSDMTMREPGFEPGRLSTPDPKSNTSSELALAAESQADGSGTNQSGGVSTLHESTTGITTRDLLRSAIYRGEPLRVLALWQPWATLAVAPDPTNNNEPPKRHETRHWRILPRALPMFVAVHAAQRYDGEVRYHLNLPRFRAALNRCRFYDPRPVSSKFAPWARVDGDRPIIFGGIIGLAVITGIYSTWDLTRSALLAGELTEDDKTFGNWEPGRWAWRLEHTILLPEPVEHTGRQQPLYELDAETRARIFAQLA